MLSLLPTKKNYSLFFVLWKMYPSEMFLGFSISQYLSLRLCCLLVVIFPEMILIYGLFVLHSREAVFSWSLSPQHQRLQFYGLASVLVLYLCSSFSVRCQICWLFPWSWWQARLRLDLIQFWGTYAVYYRVFIVLLMSSVSCAYCL